jgi:hypothetical protein
MQQPGGNVLKVDVLHLLVLLRFQIPQQQTVERAWIV